MKKRKLQKSLLMALCLLLLASCGEKDDEEATKNKDKSAEIIESDQEADKSDAEEESSDKWKQAYISYIEENGKVVDSYSGESMEVYKLVNIDDDDIPELYVNYGTTAGGDAICSYNKDSIIVQTMWNYGFAYLEGQNLFRDAGGHMDSYYDDIYCIKDGEFVLLYSGQYGAAENDDVQFDSDGNPVYNYTWNGTEVSSESEYLSLLNEVYDTKQEVNPYDGAEFDSESGRYVGNGLCDYEEILEDINNY